MEAAPDTVLILTSVTGSTATINQLTPLASVYRAMPLGPLKLELQEAPGTPHKIEPVVSTDF